MLEEAWAVVNSTFVVVVVGGGVVVVGWLERLLFQRSHARPCNVG